MKEQERKFDLDDIAIVPSIVSDISSRSECDIKKKFVSEDLTNWRTLPLMASPMDTVVCEENADRYIKEGIIPCMPRGSNTYRQVMSFKTSMFFQAFGLAEIESQLYNEKRWDRLTSFYQYSNVLIDIANGHMSRLVQVVKDIKERYPSIKLMVGNVAHPLTYKNLALAGADYVRLSIGTGCFTPGQIIKLKDNEKNIEDIQIGDEVLTHKNKYQEVKNKFEYEMEGEIYKVNNISCTKTHEFYVIETQYKDIVNDENIEEYAKWISAEELDKEKHLLIEY
jgi:IMP dehydrogenase/GMP reductase